MSEERDLDREELNEMKDELQEEAVQEEEIDSIEDVVEEVDVKEKAKSHGHKSLEEFIAAGGKAEDYKTEKEFVLTGELIDLKKTIQKRDRDIEEILKYNKNVIEQQKINARAELDRLLAEARQNMDVDAVEKLTIQKANEQYEDNQSRMNELANSIRRKDEEFIQRNATWFNDNHPELKSRAFEIGNRLKLQNPNIPYDQMASEIENQMKFELSRDDRYAHLVADTASIRRPQPSSQSSAVAKSGALVGDSDDKLYAKLSANEKNMYNIHKRIASKLGEKVSVKEFLDQVRRDEEI
jgi:hypothetical protein